MTTYTSEDMGVGTLPYPYTTNEPEVNLTISEYKYNPTPMNLKISWTQETELWISKKLIDEASYEIKNALHRECFNRIIERAAEAEQRRLMKIAKFQQQMHNAETVQFLKTLRFRIQTGLIEVTNESTGSGS